MGPQVSPLIAGLHAFVVMLIGSWVARRSVVFSKRFGMRRTFLFSTLIQNLLILPAAIFLHPAVVFVLLLRNAPKGLYMAPLSAEVNDRIPTNLRATYLSLQSLVGRLTFAVLLSMLSFTVGDGLVDWSSLSRISEFSFYAGITGWMILLLTARFVEEKPSRIHHESR